MEDRLERRVELGQGRSLVVREAVAGDAEGLSALYGRLPPDDRRFRFFTPGRPTRAVVDRWLAQADRGGVVLVAEVHTDDGTGGDAEGEAEGGAGGVGPLIVGEAGFARLENGNGELGITIDPTWRGWLGPYLLDALVEAAAARGVPNLEAEVLADNQRMLTLVRGRGLAVVDHPEVNVVRVVIGTGADVPSWPPPSDADRPRVLVEAGGGRWRGEAGARQAGVDVITCPGPGARDRRHPCPLLEGALPLVEGADAIVFALPASVEGADEILAAHRGGERPVVVDLPGRRPAEGEAGVQVEACSASAGLVALLRRLIEG